MNIDFWGLGLQALNVLILVWLLSRVFWRPVAAAIAKRQVATQTMLNDAKTTQAKADAALIEVNKTRAGIAAEREALLAEAAKKAESEAKATLGNAQEKADKLLDAARLAREREADVASMENEAKSSQLAIEIARKLLERLGTDSMQTAFLDLLIEAIEQMPPNDRAALADSTTGIDLVSALNLKDTDKSRITKAIQNALGSGPELTFVTDPDLIAGLEMRTAHFVLHNSWRSDLAMILKNVNHEAK